MLKLYKILFLLIFISLNTFAQKIDIDKAPLGEPRLKIDQKSFNIKVNKLNVDFKIITAWDKHSFEWVRVQDNLLVPRARLKVKIKGPAQNFSLKYKDKIINFQGHNNISYTEFFYSLYEKDNVEIFQNTKIVATISVSPAPSKNDNLIVDYSCSRNNIMITGLEDEYFSIGCYTRRIGQFGNEKPMLEIMWISPQLEILEHDSPIHYGSFLNKLPIQFKVKNIYTQKIKTVTISARIPKRLHRLFTAYGFGPYILNSEINQEKLNVKEKKSSLAPALFFYLNYKISDTVSIRGFDAAVFKETIFNNAGVYLGNDFGYSLDNKLYFTTLLGVQYLYFKFDEDHKEVSEAIFPQGLEFMYRHAFDIPNYIISGGVFLSTTDTIDYQNIWVRWGQKYFWELNLISWGKDEFQATTWGLSVGFPFKGFL